MPVIETQLPTGYRTVSVVNALDINCGQHSVPAGTQCPGDRVCSERIRAAMEAAAVGMIEMVSYEPPEPLAAWETIPARDRWNPPVGKAATKRADDKAARARAARQGQVAARREQAVRLRGEGMLIKEIAEAMGMSHAAISAYLRPAKVEADQ